MSGRSAGGLVLLLIGSLALIGFLTGNLDRWLAYLFVPAGTAAAPAGAVAPASSSRPAAGDRRGLAA